MTFGVGSRVYLSALTIAATLLLTTPVLAQVNMTTQHNDNHRTGANLAETTLTTSNVSAATFGKLFTRAVDDQIYGQPLYVSGVDIPGVGVRNVVYVATVNDSVYAFDADDPSAAAPLWKAAYADPANGVVPVVNSDVGQACGIYADFSGNIGIVGTPVIDATSKTIYFVARTTERGEFVQRLHALDIRTGAERPNSPVVVQASVTGNGEGGQNGVVPFDPQTENQRPALALANNRVYVGWASHCDTSPYHGWIIAYDASTLAQVFAFNVTPDGGLGGIWQSGQGVSVDDDGFLYFSVGNGTCDAHRGGRNVGNSVVKLDSSGRVADWFTPFNFEALNQIDADLGSAGVLLIPDSDLATTAGKEGKLYLLDRDNLGRFHRRKDRVLQSIQVTGIDNHLHGSPVYWKNAAGEQFVYLWPEDEQGKAFKLVGRKFKKRPVMLTTLAVPQGMPGAMLSISANGSAAGSAILWASHPLSGNANQEVRPGILRAYDANDLTRELWNSQMVPARDDLGKFAKFSYPTIANGKVYLATFSNQLMVYGLFSSEPNAAPVVSAGADQSVMVSASATLNGTATDDGRPASPGTLSTTWVQVTGPGVATFANPRALSTTVTFSLPGAYVLRLTASDGALATDSQTTISVQGGPPVVGTGTGLSGAYFDNIDFTGTRVDRLDPTIDFLWDQGSPAPGIGPDTFSVRWSGQVQAQYGELYKFSTESDDGVRLWVDGKLIVDNWTDHARRIDNGYLALVAGRKYDIRMEMYENGGDAVARLSWSSLSTPRTIIPRTQLYPAPAASRDGKR